MSGAKAPREVSASARADASPMATSDTSPPDVHDVSCTAAPGVPAPVACEAFTAVEPDTSGRPRGDGSRAPCGWCGGPIPARARRDAQTCSTRCRQARHRFTRAAGRATVAAATRLRLAYADPPYPGKAWLYKSHRDYGGEVDHAVLIRRLSTYDGWALSTSAAALPMLLRLCPPGVRVAAWHRGPRPAASWQPLSAWEPVLYVPARPVDPARGRRADSLVHGVSAMTTLPSRVIGTKPAAVCAWIFGLLGAAAGDSLDDLFPGSGAVTRAWAAYTSPPPARRHP